MDDLIVNENFDQDAFYASFPLPPAADPVFAAEIEAALVSRLVLAGYHPTTAPVRVRSYLRWLAQMWGCELPTPPPRVVQDMDPLVLTGELVFESLDDGGEAMLVELDTGGGDSGIWVRLVSNLGEGRMVVMDEEENRFGTREDHQVLNAWIGRRVRITVEPLG